MGSSVSPICMKQIIIVTDFKYHMLCPHIYRIRIVNIIWGFWPCLMVFVMVPRQSMITIILIHPFEGPFQSFAQLLIVVQLIFGCIGCTHYVFRIEPGTSLLFSNLQ